MGARGREAPDGVFPPAGSRGVLRGERGLWTDGGSEPRGARWRGAGAGELRIGASGKSRCVLRSCSPESALATSRVPEMLQVDRSAAGGGRGADVGGDLRVRAQGTSQHIPPLAL